MQEKITLQHPDFGHFEGKGDTVKEASKNCLVKIAKELKSKKLDTAEIKLYLSQASKLIVKNVNKRR